MSVVGGSNLGTFVPHTAVQDGSNGALTTSERWLTVLLEHSSDLIAVVDDQARVLYTNPATERTLGYVPGEHLGRSLFELLHPDDLDATKERFFAAIRREGTAPPAVFRFRTASGDWRVVEATATNRLNDPVVNGIVVNARDVTEQTNMSRALRTLGQGNQVLVHAAEEDALLADTCQTIVASGGYLLAWVGYVEHDEAHTVRPVASAGRTEYLNGLYFSWGNDDLGRGPTGTAIRSQTVQVLKDIHRSKKFRWRAAADNHGLRTLCALPLVVGNDAIGALSIYAGEPGAFDPDEVAILLELADDLAYGIGRLRDADRLAHAEALLREAERIAHVGHWEWDLATGRVDFMAEEMFAIYGITPAEWSGNYEAFLLLTQAEERRVVEQTINGSTTSGTAEVEHRIVRPDGEVRFVRTRTETIRDSDGEPVRIVGTCQDITEQKAAETAAEEHSHFLEELLEAIPVPVHYKDVTLRYVGCNEAFARSSAAPGTRSSARRSSISTRPGWPNASMPSTASCSLTRSGQSRTRLGCLARTALPPHSDPQGCLLRRRRKPSGNRRRQPRRDRDPPGRAGARRQRRATALTLEGAVAALGATTELRDPYTAGHQRRVAELACAIGLELGWNEARLKSLRIAARPARHRQDRPAGRDPRQAGTAQRDRDAAHPPARRRRRRDRRLHRLRVKRGGDDPPAPRAPRRLWLPGRPARRGDPAGGTHPGRRRRRRGDDQPPALPPGVADRGGHCRARGRRRPRYDAETCEIAI